MTLVAHTRSGADRSSRRRRLIVGLSLVATLSVGLPTRATQPNRPTMKWQGDGNVVLLQGTSEPVPVTVTPNKDVPGASLWVSPELDNIIQSPISLGDLVAHQPYAITLRVSVPMNLSVGSIDGTLHVRSSGRTIATPFPITVGIAQPGGSAVPARATAPSPDRLGVSSLGAAIVKDELVVIVSYAASDPTGTISAIAGSLGAVLIGAIPEARIYQLQLPSTLTPEHARPIVAQMDGVDSVALSYLAPAPPTTPNDGYSDPWDESGLLAEGDNWNLELIRAPAAWSIETGLDVPVGILDMDFDPLHRDLAPNIDVADVWGSLQSDHGNHVSGIACAEGNNGEGVAGVAWRCSLRLYDVGQALLTSTAPLVAQRMLDASRGYRSTDGRGARVINMSLAFVRPNSGVNCPGAQASPSSDELDLRDQVNAVLGRAIEQTEVERPDGVLWVFAAGNGCWDAGNETPASLTARFPRNTITTAAVDRLGALSTFSNFGRAVTVAAPGGDGTGAFGRDIWSTLGTWNIWPFRVHWYGFKGGTSMAAPHVTGLAALVWSKHPQFTASQVRNCIVNAVSSANPVPGHTFGVITAPEAVECISSTGGGPRSALYLTMTRTGLASEIQMVQGASVVRRWPVSNGYEMPLAVGASVRTMGVWPPYGGREYTLDGVPTGVVFGNAGMCCFYDGTTDGTWNYAIWDGLFIDPLGPGVYRFNLDWTNPTLMFRSGVVRSDGITYDPTDNSFWLIELQNLSGTRVEHRSMTGALLGTFITSSVVTRTVATALALDHADGTLWFFGGQASGRGGLVQYSKSGVQLSAMPFGMDGNPIGGEFALPR